MTEKTITVYLQQQSDYRFEIHFEDNMPVLTSDEPAPLGTGTGPSPVEAKAAKTMVISFFMFKSYGNQ